MAMAMSEAGRQAKDATYRERPHGVRGRRQPRQSLLAQPQRRLHATDGPPENVAMQRCLEQVNYSAEDGEIVDGFINDFFCLQKVRVLSDV